MTREAKRIQAREYARRIRARQLAAKNATAGVCQKGLGSSAICGARLDRTTDGNGRLVTTCPLCERRARGICRECPLPVAGRVGYAIRCEAHTAKARRGAEHRYAVEHRDELRAKARAFYQTNDERRERKNARKRLWRKAHPDKVKAYKRTEALKQAPTRLEYHKKRRERERTELASRERARYRGVTEIRTCISADCDIVVTGRKKKCTKCKARDLATARALWSRVA